jgi:hypothetical protein
MDIADEIRSHLLTLAPHVAGRRSAGLLRRSLDEIARLRTEQAVLVSALRHLFDEQNGPPLWTRIESWGTAMRVASQLIRKHEA